MTVDGPEVVGFRRHLRVEVRPGEGAVVFSENAVTTLNGPHVEAVVPLLDGTHTPAEVSAATGPAVPPQAVTDLLGHLRAANLVDLRMPADTVGPSTAWWDALGVVGDPSRTTGPVAVASWGVDPEPVRVALAASGVAVTDGDDPDAALSVVLCRDYLDPVLADRNTAHRAGGRPWLLAKPVGTQVWIGPVFSPGEPGCWECLAQRLRMHRRAELALGEPGSGPLVTSAVTAGLAGHLVALEALKWCAGYRHPGQRAVWTLDTGDLAGERHALPVRPQCPGCGRPELVAERQERPVVLSARPVRSDSGGCGRRAVPPDELYGRLAHLVSPVTGVVKRIEPDARGPAGLNAFRAGPNLAAPAGGMAGLAASMRSENGGKGTSRETARLSALCEAIERYCGQHRGDESRRRTSLRALGEQAVHPHDCLLFSDEQYARRDEWNAVCTPANRICAPFDPDAEVDWTPLWSLTGGRHRHLPTAQVFYGTPDAVARRTVVADSTGCAAGSSPEDAVLQGLLEIVERDAVALWWYNRTPAPEIALGASGDPWTAGVLDLHAGLGREVWALDLTADTGIPVVVALSRKTGGPTQDILFGFGAHLDPAVATRRALAELNQMMPMVVGGRGRYGCRDRDVVTWWETATVEEHTHLRPAPGGPVAPPPDLSSPDLLTDVTTVVDRIEALGMEVLVLDQTAPDIDLSVVRTVVPGMRPWRPRFAPGRLYDVPVRLGRLDRPIPPSAMNPLPMFL